MGWRLSYDTLEFVAGPMFDNRSILFATFAFPVLGKALVNLVLLS